MVRSGVEGLGKVRRGAIAEWRGSIGQGRVRKMVLKVKYFDAGIRTGKFEEKINDFILGKDVKSIQFAASINGVAALVVYEE